MRNHAKLGDLERADEFAIPIYRMTREAPGLWQEHGVSGGDSKIAETEKVSGARIRSMRKNEWPSAYSLTRLSRCDDRLET